MSLHKGNSKIKDLYKGTSKVTTLWKGNSLIYDTRGLKLWGFDDGSVSAFLLGTYDTDGIYIPHTTEISSPYSYEISSITGILGESGSAINTTVTDVTITYTYTATTSVNGKIIYAYKYATGIAGDLVVYVLEGSEIGDTILDSGNLYFPWSGFQHPSAVTENSMTFNNVTFDKNSSLDCAWSKGGVS